MKAVWKDTVLAESNETVVVEGNHYFPPDAIHGEYFEESDHETVCNWKGDCNYYNIVVDGETNENAAWVYREPKEAAKEIKDYVAFWKGVEVVE
jgi:uncharacterized protein (DUF427 family)